MADDARSSKPTQVSRADRRFVSRDPKDAATGNPESLAGKISVKEMGDKVRNSEVSNEIKQKSLQVVERKAKRTKRSNAMIMESQDNLEGVKYFPITPEDRETFGLVMNWVQSHVNDVSHDTLVSASDTVIDIIKTEGPPESNKKKEIEQLVGSVSNESFSQIISLCKQIRDPDEQDTEARTQADKDYGVAVAFGDDDADDQIDSEDEPDSEESDSEQSEMVDEDSDEPEEDIIISGRNAARPEADSGVVPAYEIDGFWLQRSLSSIFPDEHVLREKTNALFEALASPMSLSQVENDIVEILDFQHFDITKMLCTNRSRIVWLTRLARATTADEKESIRNDMKNAGLQSVLNELDGQETDKETRKNIVKMEDTNMTEVSMEPRIVDLDDLIFEEGSHLYSGGKLTLPNNTTQMTTKTYEEYDVPAPERHVGTKDPLIPIEQLPEWARPAFGTATSLNTVQSKVYPTAFGSEENLLLCAPTGAGKTNVALLTMLRTISEYRDAVTGSIDLDAFKMVYVAPLKALVQEQVREFTQRLEPFGISVGELTGDQNLTKSQIRQTQLIVTTPEKWDVITRKSFDTSYTNLVRLIILDEIHLLHDERGPVIESIVSRTVRKNEIAEDLTRLVGLSATLPNFKDVASFLHVQDSGLFYFDATYRPCPLAQKFIGITEKKAIKRYQAMNDACYDKVMEYAGKHQVIIFVHSRKETAKTARFLRDKALESGTLNLFLQSDSSTRQLLKSEADEVQNEDLKDLLPTGFAIHHAGLNRSDRASAEELFADKRVQVLVCTATLAWGVNLPAHTVIIKGTQVYNPEKGRWTELSPQDVLQMLGRAGRPRYDDSGEGIIITAHSELTYYMSLLNARLPIESQLMSKLADSINAEVVLGSINNRQEAVDWLGYTYLFVRMLRSPKLYRIGGDYDPADKSLVQRRLDLAHSALTILDKSNLLRYDTKTGNVQPTELGKISSHYYITHNSMATYNKLLKPHLGPIDVFRIFALSDEFRFIPVRQEEKLEIQRLLEMAPVPIKESEDDPAAKVNVLLQSYISRLKLTGFALTADMICITQSAGRLFRAIYEICLRKGWASLTRILLDLCKMVERKMWLSSSPFRQFPSCPVEVIKKTESSQMPWSRYFDLSDAAEVGQAIRAERYAKQAFQMLQQFPRLDLTVHFQPISPSLLKIELEIRSKFEWNKALHGLSQTFVLLVEDGDGERILFHDTFVLRERYSTEDHIIEFTIPILDPVPPVCFASLISDKWLHSESRVAVSLRDLVLPAKFPAYTPVYDLQPISVSELKIDDFIELYPFKFFNKIQSQAFHALFDSDKNVLIGTSPGNGKTVCGELALLAHWKDPEAGKVVFISPFQEVIDAQLVDWVNRFHSSPLLSRKKINKLDGGELLADLRVLEQNDLILATPEQWDILSRRWNKRRHVQAVELVIADDVQMIGGLNGAIYEIILARMRYMGAQTERPIRIIGLSVSLANGKDVGQWLGASSQTIYNFSPEERTHPVEVHLQSFYNPHHPSMMIAMARPAFKALKNVQGSSVVFVNDHQQCINTSLDLLRLARGEAANENLFVTEGLEQVTKLLHAIHDDALRDSLSHGIGHYFRSMHRSDKEIVETLFQKGVVKILIATRETCYNIPRAETRLVVILGTQIYEGQEHRYVDYPISEILQMIGRCNGDTFETSKCLVLTNSTKKEYYRKFLSEALPVESHLHGYLQDAFLSEISVGVIQSPEDAIDWLTYSYFYRRLQLNPSYYGLTDKSDSGVNEYLSELIETVFHELVDAKLIDEEEDMTVSPANGARIAGYYNVSFITMQTFMLSLTGKTKLSGILEIVTSANEFESAVPIRNHEDKLLAQIYSRVPLKSAEVNYESPRFKAFILTQAHLSRFTLPADLLADQKVVLEKILTMLAASVDVLSMEAHLNAMYAMDLSQMIVQAMWDRDSPLKQIPYFDNEIIERCKAEGIETVYDFMGIEDDDVRNRVLNMSDDDPKMSAIADFVNNYPSVDISEYEVDQDSLIAGEESSMIVTLNREMDEDSDTKVRTQFYPFSKTENWWLVIGSASKRELYGIKRLQLSEPEKQVEIKFIVPTSGSHNLTVWLTCDSYLDVDKEIEVEMNVAEGQEEEES